MSIIVKRFLSLCVSILLFGLYGCIDTMDVIQYNVSWKSDNDLLTFTIEGIDTYVGTGTFGFNDKKIPVVVYLSMPSLELIVFDETSFNQWIDTGDDRHALIMFGCKLNGSSHKLSATTLENNTGLESYDNLSFGLSISRLNKEELNAANHIRIKWANINETINFMRNLDSAFNQRATGNMLIDNAYISTYLLFKSDHKFEIYRSSDEMLLLSGSYETSEILNELTSPNHLVTLVITESNLDEYKVNMQISLSSSKLDNE